MIGRRGCWRLIFGCGRRQGGTEAGRLLIWSSMEENEAKRGPELDDTREEPHGANVERAL